MQSSKARLAVFAVAALAAVGLFVLLSGEEEEPGTPTAERASSAEAGGGQAKTERPDQPRARPEPEAELTKIRVEGGQPDGGVAELSVERGEEVRFRVVSEGDGEVHVHGYEIYEDVAAGKPVTVSFPAEIEGAFEIELHDHALGDIPIAELEVQPS